MIVDCNVACGYFGSYMYTNKRANNKGTVQTVCMCRLVCAFVDCDNRIRYSYNDAQYIYSLLCNAEPFFQTTELK